MVPWTLILLALLAGCGETERPPPPPIGDAGPLCPMLYRPDPTPGDVDSDGMPNDMDSDADGDGFDNRFEYVGGWACSGPDADGDGVSNWLDLDSDADGLLDGDEREARTNAYVVDSDTDGASDLVELRGSRTDPLDPAYAPFASDPVVVLPTVGTDREARVRFENRLELVDIFFLVDTTGSMGQERTNLIKGMREVIIPAAAAEFRQVQFGAGGLDDYPVAEFGSGTDQPFYLLTKMIKPEQDDGRWSIKSGENNCPKGAATNDVGQLGGEPNEVPDIVDAVGGYPCHTGGDIPEAFVPALWATATGRGLRWPDGDVPNTTCPAGTTGYPCFRADAIPIVVLIGDAAFHNGPGGTNPYGASVSSPTYLEAIAALDVIGARVVVSIFSGPPESRVDYEMLAQATGALRRDGSPLVFNINENGDGLDKEVVNALTELAGSLTQDVSVALQNLEGNPDGYDATTLVASVVTGEGFAPGGTPGPNPGVSYTSKDGTTFYAMVGGSDFEYVLVLRNTTRRPVGSAEVQRLRVVAVGAETGIFSERNVYVVIPAEGTTVRI